MSLSLSIIFYDALVDAEAQYEDTDDSIRQDYVMAMNN